MLAPGPRAARGGGGAAAAPQTGAAEATGSSATSSTLAAAASTSTVRILVSILRAFLCVRHGLLAIAIQISHLVSYRSYRSSSSPGPPPSSASRDKRREKTSVRQGHPETHSQSVQDDQVPMGSLRQSVRHGRIEQVRQCRWVNRRSFQQYSDPVLQISRRM